MKLAQKRIVVRQDKSYYPSDFCVYQVTLSRITTKKRTFVPSKRFRLFSLYARSLRRSARPHETTQTIRYLLTRQIPFRKQNTKLSQIKTTILPLPLRAN